MPFPRKLLNDNEDVILDLRPHWWFLSGPVTAVVLTVALTTFVAAIGAPGLLLVAALALVLVTLVWLLLRFLRWTTTNFVVTTDRLVFRLCHAAAWPRVSFRRPAPPAGQASPYPLPRRRPGHDPPASNYRTVTGRHRASWPLPVIDSRLGRLAWWGAVRAP